MRQRFDTFNMAVALRVTRVFGSVWTFYLFALYGLLPLAAIFSRYYDRFLYWSSWVQLWALPVIMVGTNLISRQQEQANANTEAHRETVLANQTQMLAHLDELLHQANQTNEQVLQAVQHEAEELDELTRQHAAEE